MRKYADIVERVEIIRNNSGLNKSQFAAALGMRPQTYNNFTGVQASKPSVELIVGVVRQFGASPQWLLNGSGPTYSGEAAAENGSGKGKAEKGSPHPKSRLRTASMNEHQLVVREVVQTLEELQVLLSRLQEDFASMADGSTSGVVN